MKKNTAALFTWCYDNGKTNYGQILQCYALQQLCMRYGISATVIKYRKLREDESLDFIPMKGEAREEYEREFKDKHLESQSEPRVQKFLSFISEHIQRSAQCYSIKDIEEEILDKEYLIVGSDQLWNPLWLDRIMLLEFADDKQHCFSYATGGITIERNRYRDTLKLIADGLDRFEYVSVREPISREILGKYTEKEIVDVLDPALMLSDQEWDQVCSARILERNYIFCYYIGGLSPHKHVLKEIAKQLDVDTILYIPSNCSNEEVNGEGLFHAVENAGPAEFLSLIKYAKAVCTDSFHGFALSIVYRREFYLMNRFYVSGDGASNGRMDNIIDKFGIGKRYANCKRDLKEIVPISYHEVYNRYDAWKQQSESYLIRALHLSGV